jgi:hypothetical protein
MRLLFPLGKSNIETAYIMRVINPYRWCRSSLLYRGQCKWYENPFRTGKFSIEYPLSWTVRERSRFDEPNAVNLSLFNAEDVLPRWDISYHTLSNKTLAEIVNYFFNARPQLGKPSTYTIRVVEPINLTKYVVDGEPAGNYIYGIRSNVSDLNVGEQTVITIHNNTAYLLTFESLADEFDSPVTTQIREHMINSIRWIP